MNNFIIRRGTTKVANERTKKKNLVVINDRWNTKRNGEKTHGLETAAIAEKATTETTGVNPPSSAFKSIQVLLVNGYYKQLQICFIT